MLLSSLIRRDWETGNFNIRFCLVSTKIRDRSRVRTALQLEKLRRLYNGTSSGVSSMTTIGRDCSTDAVTRSIDIETYNLSRIGSDNRFRLLAKRYYRKNENNILLAELSIEDSTLILVSFRCNQSMALANYDWCDATN